jgi:DNA processing protein
MIGERRPLSESERVDWLRLSRTQQVGPVTFFALLTRFGSAANAIAALPDLAKRAGRTNTPKVPPAGEIVRELERAAKLGMQALAACEPGYPEALAAIEDAPPLIFAGQNLALLGRPCVAIVGARNASTNGKRIAEALARDLVAAGLVVVSGLARGIDSAAHRAALEGGTIAVVAGGVDIVYPPENAGLQHEITVHGCVVGEAPLGAEPMARHFPRRNRIISGLSPGVIVVEAAQHSGSLITARMALEQGREVFAVPGSPLDPRAQGANNLIRQGATLTETAEDVLRVLSVERRIASAPTRLAFPDLFEPPGDEPDAARAAVLEGLGASPVPVDELTRDCQVPLPMVLTILLELELAGRLERHPGQRVSLIQNMN